MRLQSLAEFEKSRFVTLRPSCTASPFSSPSLAKRRGRHDPFTRPVRTISSSPSTTSNLPSLFIAEPWSILKSVEPLAPVRNHASGSKPPIPSLDFRVTHSPKIVLSRVRRPRKLMQSSDLIPEQNNASAPGVRHPPRGIHSRHSVEAPSHAHIPAPCFESLLPTARITVPHSPKIAFSRVRHSRNPQKPSCLTDVQNYAPTPGVRHWPANSPGAAMPCDPRA